jgi:hypothetical protein
MAKRRRHPRPVDRLVFFIPIVAIVIVVAFALYSTVSSQSGTLVVEAWTSGRYSPSVQLHVLATVGTMTGLTPFNLSLGQGMYTMSWSAQDWYHSPPPRSILVVGGKVQYSLGIYNPVLRVVSVTPEGFNSTAISALHGVTPVVWVNRGSGYTLLLIDTLGNVVLQPSENFTHVFPSTGTFHFELFNTNFGGYVQSS